MKTIFIILIAILSLIMCKTESSKNKPVNLPSKITCTENYCKGTYTGPEFVNSADVAHQFSNKMCKAVGDNLKELYHQENYSIVEFSKIIMTTKGMGSGEVIYYLYIAFSKVSENCSAYTSFDHVGGWNHKPALEKRKKELNNVLLDGDSLVISTLKKTPEGLQEYWNSVEKH